MARIKYLYNTETCKFEKASLTWQSAIKTTFSYLVVSLIFTTAIVGIRFFLLDNPKEKFLINRNVELKSSIQSFEDNIAQLEADINVLHQRDNDFYRTLLNIDKVSPGVWNGGIGGTAEIRDLGDDALNETETKLKNIAIKVELQNQSFTKLFQKFSEKEDQLQHMPSIRPIKGAFVSGYGMRHHPILGIRKLHTGIDFAAKTGTPVYATGDGKIAFAGVHRNGYGKHININHDYGYSTKYAHLSKLLVKKGQKVKRGDLIGYSGNTGLSKGPHLHYEILKGGKKIDPIDYFYSDLSPEEYLEFKKQSQHEHEPMD